MNKKIRTAQKILLAGGACGAALLVSAAGRFDPQDDQFATLGWIAPVALERTNLEATFDNTAGGTALFRPDLRSVSWKGDLLRYNVAADGSLSSTSAWSAQARFDANMQASSNYWDTGRIIFTGSNTGGVPFRTENVAIDQQTTCDELVDYVRGRETMRLRRDVAGQPFDCSHGFYKPRYSYDAQGNITSYNLLGDIVHSNPVYVGAPKDNLGIAGYDQYKHEQRLREGRVYVGANDGMLHAFDAATGDEVFAYVPSMLHHKLRKLTGTKLVVPSDTTTPRKLEPDQSTHDYFVDGELSAGDVQIGSAWQTVLVGGLGAGGCSLFALNVTDEERPASETAAAQKLIWELKGSGYPRLDNHPELTDQTKKNDFIRESGCAPESGDPDLGFTYGKPVIARLKIGNSEARWYAITGNGYNSKNGKAALYALGFSPGSNGKPSEIGKIVVGAGSELYPNGLSSPTVVDVNEDGIADVAYAGDLDGSLWRFDLNSFQATLLFQTDPGLGQSITTAPQIARHPNGGLLVYFGTGELFRKEDIAASTDSIYAIWDRGDGQAVGNSRLFQQTLKTETLGSGKVRVATNASTPDWNGATPNLGWKMNLQPGERVLTHPQLRAKRLQLVTTNPTVSGGENWALEIDYLNAGGPDRTIFDLNGDGALTSSDHVDANGDGDFVDINDRPLGRLLGGGILSQPVLARLRNGADATYINGVGLPARCSGTSCGQLIDTYKKLVDAISLLNGLYAASADPSTDPAVADAQREVERLEADLNGLAGTGVTEYNIDNARAEAAGAVPAAFATTDARPPLKPKPGPAFGLGRRTWAELH